MGSTGIEWGAITGDRKFLHIAQDTHFGGNINDTAGKEFLEDLFGTILRECVSHGDSGKLFNDAVVLGFQFLAGLEFLTGFRLERPQFLFPGDMDFMRSFP